MLVCVCVCVGIGVDNMFVFVAAYDNLSSEEKKGLEVSEKIALMVKHAGVSILITSLTDFSAFAIGASTVSCPPFSNPSIPSYSRCSGILSTQQPLPHIIVGRGRIICHVEDF